MPRNFCPFFFFQARQKHFCKFCYSLVSQLPRHLKTIHKTENEVNFMKVLTPGRKRARLVQLRKEGDSASEQLIINGRGPTRDNADSTSEQLIINGRGPTRDNADANRTT
uniref:Uncharacterized protein n=1 Tax=Cacopsylla melanoneura TaxID=428564 RepID=A0A8D9EKC8_9HEMI